MNSNDEQSIPSRGSHGSPLALTDDERAVVEKRADRLYSPEVSAVASQPFAWRPRDILASGNRWMEIRVAFAIAVASALVMLCGVRLIVWAGSWFE